MHLRNTSICQQFVLHVLRLGGDLRCCWSNLIDDGTKLIVSTFFVGLHKDRANQCSDDGSDDGIVTANCRCSHAYGREWNDFFRDYPDATQKQVLDRGRELARKYGFGLNY